MIPALRCRVLLLAQLERGHFSSYTEMWLNPACGHFFKLANSWLHVISLVINFIVYKLGFIINSPWVLCVANILASPEHHIGCYGNVHHDSQSASVDVLKVTKPNPCEKENQEFWICILWKKAEFLELRRRESINLRMLRRSWRPQSVFLL